MILNEFNVDEFVTMTIDEEKLIRNYKKYYGVNINKEGKMFRRLIRVKFLYRKVMKKWLLRQMKLERFKRWEAWINKEEIRTMDRLGIRMSTPPKKQNTSEKVVHITGRVYMKQVQEG